MAENSAPFYSLEVIDLTQSDDEDPVGIRTASSKTNPPSRAQAPGFISHHGLPTPFDPPTTHRNQVQKPSAILPRHARDPRPQVPPQKGLSNTNGNSSLYYRKSTGQASSSNETSSISAQSTLHSERPVKRRKTHGGTHLESPILPPPSKYKRTGQLLQAQHLSHVKSPSLVKTIISGASRAESSQTPRVSPEGRLQKPRTTANSGHGQKAEDCINNQVFRHVKDSLRPYQDTLPKATREIIGSKASKKLVGEPEFYLNYHENDGRLSKEYESNLIDGAKAYVDSYAEEALEELKPNTRAPSKSRGARHTASSSAPTPRHLSSKMLLSSTVSESYSSDEEEIFENLPESTPRPAVQRFDGSLRTYSSSPATSFSNDHTDGEKAEERHTSSSVPATANRTQQLRRSARTTVTLGTSPDPSLASQSKRVPKLTSKSKQRDILKQDNAIKLEQIDVKAARKVQTLDLASRDTTLARPYLSYASQEDIKRGLGLSYYRLGQILSRTERQVSELLALHVDFCLEEMKILLVIILNARGNPVTQSQLALDSRLPKEIMTAMACKQQLIPKILQDLKRAISQAGDDKGRVLLRRRNEASLNGFLQDAAIGEIAVVSRTARLEARQSKPKTARRESRIASLLTQREVYGTIPHRICNGEKSFSAEVANSLEDSLARLSEWTDCCGDISAISWTSKTAFVCGATAHSDSHNMQYNKPGNLVLGSSCSETLRAISNHRIIRPKIGESQNAENSRASMWQTQSPWLFTSVVSTAHSKNSGFTFTASFDQTVKVWTVAQDGSRMELRGAWYHNAKVNFVVTSEHHNRVATASDVIHNAVRVYCLDEEDIQQSAYDEYSSDRAQEQGVELRRRETWAYFPATIQWGKAYNVAHLLLVGYSPRSVTADDQEIPEDKQNTGELCLWNVEEGSKVTISSAKMQNVFEVLWHPTQPMFLAATSPSGIFEPGKTKTQIRVFAQLPSGAFQYTKVLDCPAMDINELTIMPNSIIDMYATASCTDGKTYVYDTAQSDRAIHILRHGESLDNPNPNMPRELADEGVKFAAWGQSKNRFYTGGSDGKLKAWDITAPPQEAFIRDVLVVSGGISAGAFSEDFSQLVIGDATGKVHLLGHDDGDLEEKAAQPAHPIQGRQLLQQGGLLPPNIRRPKVLIPHPDPPPPVGSDHTPDVEPTGRDLAQTYIEEGYIRLHEDSAIGAVQGVNYSETGLFRTEAHESHDGTAPLLPAWQEKQQTEVRRQKSELCLPILLRVNSSDPALHKKNTEIDLEVSKLPLSTLEELKRDGVELDWDDRFNYANELFPGRSFELFKKDPQLRSLRKQQERSLKIEEDVRMEL